MTCLPADSLFLIFVKPEGYGRLHLEFCFVTPSFAVRPDFDLSVVGPQLAEVWSHLDILILILALHVEGKAQ